MNKKLYLTTLFLALSLLAPSTGFAVITLPWSTTFNCAEWTQSDGLTEAVLNCDGMAPWGSWTCKDTPGDPASTQKEEQVTLSANNPGGGGGRGKRMWVGDTLSNNSGSLKVEFTQVEPELWVRWYMRFESGFQWSPMHSDKGLYWNSTNSTNAFFVGFHDSDKVAFRVYTDSRQTILSNAGVGWQTIMGGTTSDGQWHYYEIHIKTDTNGANGIGEMWIDGDLKLSLNDIDYNTGPGWLWFIMGDNKKHPNNSRCMSVDIDDMEISTTGYIGPIVDTVAPSPPTNLR